MVSLDTVQREIEELEARGQTTYAVCERLAWLYVVRDHLGAAQGTERMAGSEFLEAASGVPYRELMKVMDEFVEAVRVVNQKPYDGLMERIRALKR